MNKLGKFIVLEGIEGAGKSSMCMNIKKNLKNFGIKEIIIVREPGSTPISEKIRKLIKYDNCFNNINFKTEILLLYAARIQLVESVIKPALKKGIWVISDRYNLSCLAYQGLGCKKKIKIIQKIYSLLLKNFQPNLTIYLDVQPSIGLYRIQKTRLLDNIERRNKNFFKIVRNTYLKILKNTPNIIFVNANESKKQVENIISKKFHYWLYREYQCKNTHG